LIDNLELQQDLCLGIFGEFVAPFFSRGCICIVWRKVRGKNSKNKTSGMYIIKTALLKLENTNSRKTSYIKEIVGSGKWL
jgi:hypothetical protein